MNNVYVHELPCMFPHYHGMCVLVIVSNSLFKLLPPCNNKAVWLRNEIAVYGLLMHPI